MANINIVYKVDSSQIDASTAKVNQAKAATDQLTASAAKLGQQGSKNNIQFGNTIEGVRLKVQQLKGQIDLTNQSDKKRLDTLISQYKAAQKQLDEYTNKLKSNTSANAQAAAGTNNLGTSLNGLYQAIKLVIGAQLVKQFVGLSIEAAALAGKVEGIEKAFNRTFPNAELLLGDLRRATHGTVTDFELMQRTLQATNLGVGIEKLPVLLEFAAARAQQTGESVDYLVDSIVRGIGRKSVLVLDNLGLSATRLKEQFNGASLASQSVGDVTQAVGRIAEEELKKMGGYVENGATKVDKLKVSWTQLGIEIAKLATGSGGVITFFKSYIDSFQTLFEAMNKDISVSDLLHKRRIDEAAQLGVNIIKQNEFTDSKEHNLKVTQEVIAEKTHELIQLQEEGKVLDQNLQKAKEAKNESIFNTQARIKNIEARQKDIQTSKTEQELLIAQIKLLKGLASTLVVDTALAEGPVDSLKVLEDKVKDLNEALQETDQISNRTGVNEARRIKEQIIATQAKIDRIKDEIYWEEVLQTRREKGRNSDLKEVVGIDKGQATNDIKSLIEGINGKDVVKPIQIPITPYTPESEWDKFADAFGKHIGDIASVSENIIKDQAQASFQNRVDALTAEIDATKKYYQVQQDLAGNNEKAKQQLRLQEDKKIQALEKERAKREKQAAKAGILVNTALGIIKAIATAATIYDGLVEAAFVAAEGASQLVVAGNARYYARGAVKIDGPGTGTSDSIPTFLSKGESVITAKETASSEKTLRMIHAKKLNDKVLDNIMAKANSNGGVVGFDDTRLLEATKQVARAAAGNDILKKGNLIYEAKKEGDKMKTYVRSKYFN
jgi:hypothetical protein